MCTFSLQTKVPQPKTKLLSQIIEAKLISHHSSVSKGCVCCDTWAGGAASRL